MRFKLPLFRTALLAFVFFVVPAKAQFNFPIERDVIVRNEAWLESGARPNFHTAVKPWRDDVIWTIDTTPGRWNPSPYRPDFSQRQTQNGKSESSNGLVEIVPLLDLQAGYDGRAKNLVQHLGGGAALTGYYKNKFAGSLRFLGGSMSLPTYLDTFVAHYRVLPGIGIGYPTKTAGVYSYQSYTGYLSWSPKRIFNLQIGNDKHFWGEGYRSLFLSDAAAPFPYLKMDTRIWHLQYVSLFGWMKDITGADGFKDRFENKFGTFHYLSWNAVKWLNVDVFEAIMWQGSDGNRYRGFDPNYLNPLIFFRPIEYSLGSSDNAFLGLGLKSTFKKQTLYAQVLLDEFYLKEIRAHNGWWANKQGLQFGWKSRNPIPQLPGLQLQAEFNFVRPYTYAHGSVQQNYAHFNQPLGDPLGSNFKELVLIGDYRYRAFLFEAKVLSATYGLDTSGYNYGHNIFLSYTTHPNDYGNKVGQGLWTQLMVVEGRVSWLMYSPYNLRLEAGITHRREHNSHWTTNDTFIWVGCKTALWNNYSDF